MVEDDIYRWFHDFGVRVGGVLSSALEADRWNQLEESIASYTRIVSMMEKEVPTVKSLSTQTKKQLQLFFTIIKCRGVVVRSRRKSDKPTIKDVESLKDCLYDLEVLNGFRFPCRLDEIDPDGVYRVGFDVDTELRTEALRLLPPPSYEIGKTFICIEIVQIGLKDAMRYVNPFISVTIARKDGTFIETGQDTPISEKKKPLSIVFDTTVYIQTPVSVIPFDSAIFFEFKHYKAKKKKLSTRCFAFLEMDEIHDGPVALEIYRKPVDYRRKKLGLLSVKPLYLQLEIKLLKQ
eukprot:TRINITY_DN14248_c1_g1_i1.p1 TRINITY_DN14248_c1_g1~~TRINITY_DN14248_c1_g1_i1.p1  ORF type:complete len:292 (-),score=71.99 TRINITY_DN14248_c1_g1_i1:46-921(-)